MEIHFYLLYALAAVSIGLGVAIFLKIKTAIYLLEQPVVKKMSPQLNLKPVKIDQVDGAAPRGDSRNGTPMNRGAGRPEGREDRPPREDRAPREDRGGRDGRGDRMPREDRGDRPPRAEGDRDRGPRGDRFGGREGGRDRDRGPRGDRGDRPDRGPRREFSGEREPAQAEGARPAAPIGDSSPAPLAPRRPLPSTVDAEGEAKPHSAPEAAPVNEAGAADPFFGRDDSDIQHGRRNQLKKKPKFEEAEVEEKSAEETKAL